MMELNQLIDYDEWANRKIFGEIEKLPEGEFRAETHRLFSHILSAQLLWYNRINAATEKVEVWPEFSITRMKGFLKENPDRLKSLIQRKGETVSYSNSAGKQYLNTIQEILVHLTIHGQHHRAQIATLLRKAGITPPGTDLIFYLRNR